MNSAAHQGTESPVYCDRNDGSFEYVGSRENYAIIRLPAPGHQTFHIADELPLSEEEERQEKRSQIGFLKKNNCASIGETEKRGGIFQAKASQ